MKHQCVVVIFASAGGRVVYRTCVRIENDSTWTNNETDETVIVKAPVE